MRSPREAIKNILARAAVRKPRLADLFYSFDGSFRDEHHAVISGMDAHREELAERRGVGGVHDFRRRIHRLEKGLVARPRREVFALDYITETVRAHRQLVANATLDADDPLSCWATGVFRDYFSVVADHPVVAEARELFEADPVHSNGRVGDRSAPFVRPSELPVGYDELLALAQRRRSVRSYLDKPVPRELIEKAVAVAAEAPSACNRQPYSFHVYDDPALVEEIGMIPAGARTFIRNAPCVVVMVGNLAAFPSAGDRHVVYIDASLAVMGFELALETLGLASCSINWREIHHLNQKIASSMGLAAHERVVMLVSVGYPDWEVPVPGSTKKTASELCVYNRTGASGEKA